MTTVEITLPDDLAKAAEQAGLLSPDGLEKWLRERLRAEKADRLFAAMARMDEADGPAFMSPEEVAEGIASMRAEKRIAAE